MNCNCIDWSNILKDHPKLFQEHSSYGSLLTWVEISNEKSYHKLHNYGIKVNFCPFCGRKLCK